LQEEPAVLVVPAGLAILRFTGEMRLLGDASLAFRSSPPPESEFRLYAVCSRFPRDLADGVALTEVKPGVYACERGTDRIRILVAGQIREEPHNAILHLFSASERIVNYGADHYRPREPNASPLLEKLLHRYQGEGFDMAYTMADFQREYALEHFKDLTPEERQRALQAVPAKERLTGIPRRRDPRVFEGIAGRTPIPAAQAATERLTRIATLGHWCRSFGGRFLIVCPS
jgi:hypothetical protein